MWFCVLLDCVPEKAPREARKSLPHMEAFNSRREEVPASVVPSRDKIRKGAITDRLSCQPHTTRSVPPKESTLYSSGWFHFLYLQRTDHKGWGLKRKLLMALVMIILFSCPLLLQTETGLNSGLAATVSKLKANTTLHNWWTLMLASVSRVMI